VHYIVLQRVRSTSDKFRFSWFLRIATSVPTRDVNGFLIVNANRRTTEIKVPKTIV